MTAAQQWTDAQRQRWAKADLWSEADLQALCCGLVPDGARPSSAPLNEAGEAIMRAVLSKALPCIAPVDATAGDRMYAHARFFRPADAIAWAGGRFEAFPFRPTAIADAATIPTRERQTFLHLVAALASMAKVDLGHASSTAAAIAHEAQMLGLPMGVRTIEEKLKEARAVMHSDPGKAPKR